MAAGLRIKNPARKLPIQLPQPRKNAPSARLLPQVSPPKVKPVRSRIYAKGVAQEDPSQFFGAGFGSTGLEELDV